MNNVYNIIMLHVHNCLFYFQDSIANLIVLVEIYQSLNYIYILFMDS